MAVVDEGGGGTVVDDGAVDTTDAPVVAGRLVVDGTRVVVGRLVVDGTRVVVAGTVVDSTWVVVGEDVDCGTVGWDASVVVESACGEATVVAIALVGERVSTSSATGPLVGGRLELVDEGGFAAEVCVTATVDAGAAVWVTSGARIGLNQTISASAMPARVMAISAFSMGRAISYLSETC